MSQVSHVTHYCVWTVTCLNKENPCSLAAKMTSPRKTNQCSCKHTLTSINYVHSSFAITWLLLTLEQGSIFVAFLFPLYPLPFTFWSCYSLKTDSNELTMQDGEFSDIFCTSKRLAHPSHLRFVGIYVLKKEVVGNGKFNAQPSLVLSNYSKRFLLIIISTWSFTSLANIVWNPGPKQKQRSANIVAYYLT